MASTPSDTPAGTVGEETLVETPRVVHARRPPLAPERSVGLRVSDGRLRTIELARVAVPDAANGERGAERVARNRSGRSIPRYFPDGMLEHSMVATEIGRRKSAIVSAYEHALRKDPTLTGRVEVRFKIDGSGRPHDIVITRDTLESSEVSRRIMQILPTWRFPAPLHGEQYYSYPFVFRPSGG